MNDALLFAGRDQRKAGLPAEMLEQLDALGKSVNDPAFAEAKLDEALTVRWLSARTGRGAREIEAMLPSVVANYFGADMTASQAYDRIVATEAAAAQGLAYEDTVLRQERAVEEAPGQAQQRQASPAAERDEVKYPGWQTPRALGAGFQEFALNVPQGLFSAAAGVLGERMPDMVDPMMDAETYRLAREAFNAEQAREQERRLSGFDPGFDEAGLAAIDAYGAALARINEANKARLDEWRKTEADGTLRKVATFWKDLADSTDERWGVDPAFAVTGYGQFVKGVGSMPATSALMAVGAVGLLGIGGATFSGVESARMDYEGEAYDPKAALFTNFLNAGGQTIIEKIIKLDGVLEKALENTAKSGGRVRLPDYLRSVARTAVGEGIEEVAQGQWDDVVATAAYDEERGAIPFFDEGVAKRRFWEFMAGAGGGAIMGSTFGGALAFDQNRAARKAGEYLTNRMGGLLNEFDAKQVRRAFTDEEIRKMKDGETLLRAVNGDAAALSAYNKGVAAEKFINLKGARYGGVTLGEVDGRPAILKEDGSVLVVDVSSPEAAKAWEDRVAVVVKMAAIAEEERAAREAAVSSLIDYITARHAERDQSGELKITRDVENRSLVDQVGSLEEAERVYASYVASGALPAGLDVRKLGPQGTSDSPWNPVTKRWDVAIEIMKGAQPTVVIEESVEDFIKRQLDTEELTIDRVMAWRAEVEGAENTLDKRGAIEWVSKYAVAYATGKAQEGDVRLPSAFRAFLERFAKFVREALELGKKLLDMERAGEIPADFLRLLQESTGTVAEKERGAREPVPMASEVDAEMLAEAMNQDDFPKIEKTEAGSFVVTAPDGQVLATMDTVEAAQDRAMAWYFAQEQAAERTAAREGAGETAGNELMDVVRRLGGLLAASKEGTMRGELKAIAENLGTAGKLRTFRKDAMDLDRLREALAEQGFDYDTPAAMLDAMERSTRGEAQYPRGAGGQTFSLGRAVPADALNVVEMPDGAKMVGPTTFSIKPDYGIQHRPNEEGPRAFDLSEGGLMPADVYEHPEWYSAMPPKVVRETATQLRKIRGKADALVTIYRAGPVGEMNPGDWISLSKEYARTHAESQDPDGFKVWAAKVAAKDVRWAMDDLAEFGYFGEKVAAQDSGVTFSLVAYHGTPHKVDKFSMAKIGTGEGAQAYGWGLYFAESKGVASYYKDVLAGRGPNWKWWEWTGAVDTAAERFMHDNLQHWKTVAELRKLAESEIAKWEGDEEATADDLRKPRAVLAALDAGLIKIKEEMGNLYTVELLPDADEFLDWDAPLSAQSEKVKAAVEKLRPEWFNAVWHQAQRVASPDVIAQIEAASETERASQNIRFGVPADVLTGQDAYLYAAQDAKMARSDSAASQALAAAGIPGIRYLDGQSRQRPLRQIKAEFLGLLPEDADFESLMAEVEAGRFNPEQTAFLRALADSDWLGFDYPAQAISAALSDQITNYETTPELLASIEPLRGEVTRNYVIFDEKLVRILEENGRKVEQGQGETFSLKQGEFPGVRAAQQSSGSPQSGPENARPKWERGVARFQGEQWEETRTVIKGIAVSLGKNGDRLRLSKPSGLGNFWAADFDSSGALVWERDVPAEARDFIIQEGKRLSVSQGPLGNSTFLRFGKIPKEGRSMNFVTGQREAGVSVYRAVWNPAFETYELSDANHAGTAVDLIAQGKKPIFVQGEVIGAGSDGEPLLRNATPTTNAKFTGSGFLPTPNPARKADGVIQGQGETFSLAQTETPAFKAWFKDSKVVDAQGRPMVVYHGTGADISMFDPAFRGENTGAPSAREGFFFTDSAEVASGYASDAGGGEGANVLPVYLSLKNPLVYDFRGNEYREKSYVDLIKQAKREGRDGAIFLNTDDSMLKGPKIGTTEPEKLRMETRGTYAELYDKNGKLVFTAELLPNGFWRLERRDSGSRELVRSSELSALAEQAQEWHERSFTREPIYAPVSPHAVYVVFEPAQIKSATGNRGTFDPTNPDITANLFYEDQGGQEASPEMQELQKKGDELDEVLAKYGRLYTNEVGKAALVRMRDEGYLAAIDAGQVALRQSRKAGGQTARLSLPSDFRAGRIIPEIGQLLRKRTIAANIKATEDNGKVVAFFVAAKRAGMTTGDLADLDHALNNGHKDVADAYAKKFGILPQLDAVRAVFEAQMAEALELGVPPGKFFNGELDEETTKKLRDAMGQAKSLPAGEAGRAMIAILEAAGMKRNVASYWPRKVLNRDALLMTLGLPGLRDEFDKLLDKAIEEAKGAGRALTEQEMDALVDQANANLQRKRFESGRKTPGSLKARVIETITKEQMVHYYKGIDAAMKHNTAMREYLETLRMFGKSVVFEPSGAEFEVLPINVTSSVGAWVVDYALKGGISSEQRRELESIVIERFSYKATPSFYAGLRSFSYLQNLTQVTTFLTATIADTWTGFYASGGSPFRYGANFAKAMQGLSKISAMDVGLDPSRITAEYEALEGLDPTFKEAARGLFSNILTEQGRAEWTPSQALQRLFGWFANKVGLRYFERVTREAHINSAVDYLIAQAKAGTLPRKLQRNLVRYFGEEKAAQVVADMKAGKADDADVRFYAFNALADWKAVSLDQMPESYLSSPKGRVFYMYKTWIPAQFAGIYHEAGQDIASGEPKRVIAGVTTLVYLAALMLSVGLPIDAIVAWVQGRPFILQDSVVNRLLGAVGAGRYVASKVTRGELKDAAMEFFAPPLGGALGDLQDDAEAIYYLGTDLDAMKLKTWRNLPGFGRVINGYLGFKSEANAEARETAGGWIALTDGEAPKKTAEELEEMKRARLAKEYSVK